MCNLYNAIVFIPLDIIGIYILLPFYIPPFCSIVLTRLQFINDLPTILFCHTFIVICNSIPSHKWLRPVLFYHKGLYIPSGYMVRYIHHIPFSLYYTTQPSEESLLHRKILFLILQYIILERIIITMELVCGRSVKLEYIRLYIYTNKGISITLDMRIYRRDIEINLYR